MCTLMNPGPRPLRLLAFAALLTLGACADNAPPPMAQAADDSYTVAWQTATALAVDRKAHV